MQKKQKCKKKDVKKACGVYVVEILKNAKKFQKILEFFEQKNMFAKFFLMEKVYIVLNVFVGQGVITRVSGREGNNFRSVIHIITPTRNVIAKNWCLKPFIILNNFCFLKVYISNIILVFKQKLFTIIKDLNPINS